VLELYPIEIVNIKNKIKSTSHGGHGGCNLLDMYMECIYFDKIYRLTNICVFFYRVLNTALIINTTIPNTNRLANHSY